MLSRMAALAEALAAGFRAQGVAALRAGDLDRAGKAEAGFSSLFRPRAPCRLRRRDLRALA
jgi:hypothetical protein